MIPKYEDLSEEEKGKALTKCLNELVRLIVEGGIRFDDEKNDEPIQKHIDDAFAKAEGLQTPWFAGEIMLEDKWLYEKLKAFALADAQEAVYPEVETVIVYLGDD